MSGSSLCEKAFPPLFHFFSCASILFAVWFQPPLLFKKSPPFRMTSSTAPKPLPSLPVKSVADLIALAKASPGTLNYGSAAAGTVNHLAAELFKSMAGVDIVRIAYKGTASILNALMAGEVQMIFATSASVTPQLRAGRLRALAVTSLERSSLFPELPTMAASGLPGFESVSLHGVFAPAKTPTVVVNRLNAAIVQVLSRAEVRDRFLANGVDRPGAESRRGA